MTTALAKVTGYDIENCRLVWKRLWTCEPGPEGSSAWATWELLTGTTSSTQDLDLEVDSTKVYS